MKMPNILLKTYFKTKAKVGLVKNTAEVIIKKHKWFKQQPEESVRSSSTDRLPQDSYLQFYYTKHVHEGKDIEERLSRFYDVLWSVYTSDLKQPIYRWNRPFVKYCKNCP